jgi:hypothetical protein
VRGQKERYWMRFLRGMVTDRNNSRVSSIDASEEGSKEGPSDNFNVSNNPANHFSVLTTLITEEEDKRTTYRIHNITPPTHHNPTIISLFQSQLIWIGPAHLLGVEEDEDVASPEDKLHKPLNRDIFPRGQNKQTSHISSVTNAAIQGTTLEIALQEHPAEPPPQT